jgi:hypothetical protein
MSLKGYAQRAEAINEQLFRLQNFHNECQNLQITPTEFAYLKIISVLDSDCLHFKLYMNQLNNKDNSEFCSDAESTIDKIRAFQILALKELKNLTVQTHVQDSERANRLYMSLLQLKEFDTKLVEEFFFSGLIGSIQIDSIIPCIVRMNSSSASESKNNESNSSSEPSSQQYHEIPRSHIVVNDESEGMEKRQDFRMEIDLATRKTNNGRHSVNDVSFTDALNGKNQHMDEML